MSGGNDVANLYGASHKDFGNQAAAVVESVSERCTPAGKLGGAHAGVAIFDPAQVCLTDSELVTNLVHELNALDDKVATSVGVVETASVHKASVEQGDLAIAWPPVVEAAFALGVAVSLQSMPGDCAYSLEHLHGRACGGCDADCDDRSVCHESLS